MKEDYYIFLYPYKTLPSDIIWLKLNIDNGYQLSGN